MGSTSQQLYSLAWGEFGSSLASAVQLLRGHGDLVDVTLAAGGQSFSAHKIVLSAASPFLLEVLKDTPCQHPVVMLAGISARDLESILEFIYKGEISVDPSQLPSLLQAAHCLSIHGLQPPTIMTEKGEQIPASAIPGCNDTIVSRDVVSSYLSQRRKKKKRKLSGGPGKWPKDYSSLEGRSYDEHSEDNRSMDYGRKDSDGNDEAKDRSDHSNHHITSPLPTHQLVHPVIEHNPTALIANPEAEPHLHNLMPMQPYSPLHIPQFTGAIQNLQFSPPPVAVNIPTVPTTAPANPTTATSPAPSTKIRGASDCPGDWNSKSRTLSDQPATCPLCGAVIRQSRNLRRHLELLHFGASSGGKSGVKVKKDQFERSLSKATLVMRDSHKPDISSYSSTTMPSLNLSSNVNSNIGSSNMGVPGTSSLNSSYHSGHHHDHSLSFNNSSVHSNPVHSISCPPSSVAVPANNGFYTTESASMLSNLFPALPTLTTLSSPHDMFRHSEFLRGNMSYPQDPTRQQHNHNNRYLQRTDAV